MFDFDHPTFSMRGLLYKSIELTGAFKSYAKGLHSALKIDAKEPWSGFQIWHLGSEIGLGYLHSFFFFFFCKQF